MTKDEIKVAIKTRFDLLERARADVATTDSDYRLYSTLLLQFYSMDTGRCNPSDAALGKAAGGKCVRTAWEGTSRLGEQGYLFKRRTRGTSYYIFPGLPLPQHLAEDKAVTSAISRENFRKIASELPHTARRTEPCLEPCLEPHGDAGASRGDAKTFQKKKKGANRDFVRVADGWLIRHGCDQYKAWRQYGVQISDGNLFYRFKDEPGHFALAPSLWPPNPKGPPK